MAGKTYVFHGEEFAARGAVAHLKASLGPADALAANTTAFDGRRVSFGEVAMAVKTVPFLADHRLVVVEGLLERFEESRPRRDRPPGADIAPERDEGPDPWAGLPALVRSTPPTTVLVFLSERLTARNPVLAQLRQAADVQEFRQPKGRELAAWVTGRVAGLGGQITPPAARLLASYAGGSLRQLDGEVQKLCLYARSRAIQEEDVRLLVADAREASVFALVDALVEGRRAEALRALRDLMDQGAAALYIIAMLARQLRMVAQVRSLRAHGASEAEMLRAIGTGSEFVLRKVRDQARACSDERLVALYRRLLEADLAIKTGALPEELTLETLVADAAGR